jgi:hypothetical protein
MEQHFCYVQARFSDMETKILFPCYGIFSTDNNVFEALDLLKKKLRNRNPAAWQFGIQQSSGMACHSRFPSHYYVYISNAATVHSSLQVKLWVWQAILSFRHKWKTWAPAPFLKLIWSRWQSGQCSSLQASVFCTIAVLALDVSITTEAEFMNLQFC